MAQQSDGMLTEPISDADWPLGSDGAPVTVVEYGDYDCGACRTAHAAVKKLIEQRGEMIRIAYRQFPLMKQHPRAMPAAKAAMAAGNQGKFWQMHDRLFEGAHEPSDAKLHSYAEELGLDMARFEGDMEDKALEREILRRRMEGLKSGLNATPSFWINGKKHEGPITFDGLVKAVDAAAEGP